MQLWLTIGVFAKLQIQETSVLCDAKVLIRCLLVLQPLAMCCTTYAFAQEASSFVAGTSPDVRPSYAPVITETIRDDNWYSQALTGVVAPYPPSLKFLEDQGNWYTPFIYPGMPGPYDIRNLHKENPVE